VKFNEAIQAMRERIDKLNNDIRNLELQMPDKTLNSGNSEIKRRLINAMNVEVAEFQSAIEFLQSSQPGADGHE
jgi:predicted  nucleic acid-binding Zn-ribbon protein